MAISVLAPLWAGSLERFSESIQYQTVSLNSSETRYYGEFEKYHGHLKKNYPLTFSKLKIIPINLSYLLIWQGSESQAPTALFNAHQDVVPVEDRDLDKWDHPPFSGTIDTEYIWGRGTLDDKVAVHALCESIESLLETGFQPKGTLYFSFTQDEEMGGWLGAHEITNYLVKNKHKIDFVYDEGLVVITDVLKQITRPVALIGVGEKGYATLKISAFKNGGHSSMPPEETSITILNRALARLSNPLFKRQLITPLKDFFSTLGEETSGFFGFVLRNPSLFEPMLISSLKKSPASDALLRTTRAITVMNAGIKDNIIPNNAEALINFRILQGNTVEDILELVKKKINDKRVAVSLLNPKNSVNPSPLSSTKTSGYEKLEQTIKEIYPDAIVAPNIMIAKTDSYHYQTLTQNIYRFLPFKVTKSDITRIHGINERLSLENYQNVLKYFKSLISKY